MTWALAILGGLIAIVAGAIVLLAAVVGEMPWLGGGSAAQVQGRTITVLPTPAAPQLVPTATADSSSAIENVIAQGMTWLGTPYRWGGCTQAGVDCSCFVENLLLVGDGIRAPRVTTDQLRWAAPVPIPSIRRGDLLFFRDTCTNCGPNPTHVAMYLGGGKFIHAGDPVQISSLSGFYADHLMAAGRPVGF